MGTLAFKVRYNNKFSVYDLINFKGNFSTHVATHLSISPQKTSPTDFVDILVRKGTNLFHNTRSRLHALAISIRLIEIVLPISSIMDQFEKTIYEGTSKDHPLAALQSVTHVDKTSSNNTTLE